MKKKKQIYRAKKLLLMGTIVAAVLGIILWRVRRAEPGANPLDGFARCLAEKNITMYGSNWCSHCQDEKKSFGTAFRYVPSVDCPRNPKLCLEKGVDSYPTWIFQDGRALVGEQGLQKLSQESGCALP